MAKERQDRKVYAKTNPEQDETSLFYSDIMPLLVSDLWFLSFYCRLWKFRKTTVVLETIVPDTLSQNINEKVVL